MSLLHSRNAGAKGMIVTTVSCGVARPVVVSMVLMLGMVIGCGKSGRIPVYPASGAVTIDGKPVGAVKIVMQPPADGKIPPAAANVAENGSFSLSTYKNNDGIAEGSFQVIVTSDPMKMVPIPATKELKIDIKRDSSGKIAPLKIDLVSAKGAKPTIGAALPIQGGAMPAMPGAMMPAPK